ncbi:MAG: shikimate dehydrogenase [Lachnospiraceae bacterium]|nr:shikimate dehydrogenase [Lachnospiraceae bacterium]
MNIPITGHTGLFGLLGSPVRHSLSPLMHNESFRYHGLDYVYLCFEIGEDRLAQAVRGLTAAGIHGFNLTMPNKNRMAELCDNLSPEADIMQAVNTVVNRDGVLTGYNTDGTGFMQAALDAGYPLAGETATVIGTGGAGTAICAQAALDGVKKLNIFARPSSRFYNRTQELADRINRDTDCEAALYDTADMTAMKNCASESKMIINATSVGMAPHTEQCVVTDPDVFHEGLVACDIIYNPRETRFLQTAASRGCRTFNGVYMLLYQGAAAFRHFTGLDMPVDLVKEKYFRQEP